MAKGDVIMRFDGQTAKMVAEIQKLQQKMMELGPAAANSGQQVVGAFDKIQDSFEKFSKADFGKALADQLGMPTSPADALGKAFQFAGEGLAFMNEEASKGAEALKKLESAQKSLIQVSNSLSELQSKRKLARDISAETGVSTEEAMKIMTAATNRGLNDEDARLFAKSSAFTTQPAALVDAVADIRGAFPKAGSSRDVINKMLAGQQASKLDLENFAEVMTLSAPSVRGLGGNDTELAAVSASAANYFGKPSTAGDRIARGASNMKKAGMKGGLVESYEEFIKLPEEVQHKAGADTIEFGAFLQFMKDKKEEILKIQGDVTKADYQSRGRGNEIEANDSDLVGRKVRLANSDPETAALIRRNKAAARREIAQGGAYGLERLGSESAIDEMDAAAIERGDSMTSKFTRDKAARAAQGLGAGETLTKAAGELGGFLGGNEADKALKLLEWIGFNTQSKGNGGGIVNGQNAGNE